MADRTMEELLQAHTKGYGEAIVILEILAKIFEIKTNLLQLVQTNKFHGFERDDPHTHISNFKRMTSTLKYRDVPNDAIKLMLFSYSLKRAARIWESSSKTDDRPDKLADQISNLVEIVNKQVITPATAKAVEKTCVIYGGAHAYYDCIATDSNQPSVCAATGTYNQVSSPNRASNQIPPPGFAPMQNNQIRYNQNQGQGNNFNRGNNFQNNQGYRAPINNVPNFQNQGFQNQPFQAPNNQFQLGIPNDLSSYMKSNDTLIRNMQNQINVLKGDFNNQEENIRRNLNNDMRSILGSFFQNQTSTLGTLLGNTVPNSKDKLFELAKVPLNENCSTILLKKLLEKLGDPDKFLIPCDFLRIDACHALADLGASINIMPLSIWKKVSFLELTPTRMTLELADRSITRPKGVAKDVFVKVGKFHFPTDFVVVDFEADPRVPLILGRSLLRTGRALIDVYGEEITLRVNDESITFNLNQTMRYSSMYDDNSEETKSEFCKEPIVESSSPTLTPFGEKPPELELKELPSHLEYAFLEESDKLPVIIAKDLKDVEKEALIKVLKSYKRAIAWKISNIKGIDLRFCTRKVLMEEDYKLAIQIQRRETPFVFSKECVDEFDTLKKKLTEASILVMLDWNLPFELMCDASDFAIDHAALKYLLNKQDAKLRLLRWVLLLQEFDIIIRDKKGSENLVGDHLSRLENPHKDVLENKDINENFPLETLGSLSSKSTPCVFMAKKLLISSKLVMKDPPRAIMVPILPRRKYVVPTGRVIVSTGRYVVPTGRVIVATDSMKRTRRNRDRRVIILSPMTAEEHIAVQRESKARTILLQFNPNDHVVDFHYIDDAKDIWNAVKARFDGNVESKKIRKYMLKQEFLEFRIGEAEGLHKGYDRMQKILSQLNQLKAKPDDKDINLKFLRALPSSWSQVALTLKTQGGLELLSFDDLYYKLKTLEVDIKGYNNFSLSQSAGPSHSAFVSSTSTSKKMSYGDSPNYPLTTTYSFPSNSKTGSHRSYNVIKDVLQSFVADTKPEQQLAYEYLGQIEKLDLGEMDLKWKMAMLSIRVHKFEQKAGRNIDFDKKESARFNKKKTDHDDESDEVITPKEFGMIVGCDSKDAIEEGAAKLYNLITGANSEEANTAGDAREFALMGVTSK
nr:reverse transcriptase domain-containing protein [Tanacetum cinerariifolium]